MTQSSDKDFIVEQYSQYWEMLRWHISASWNIPALSLLVFSGILGFSIDKLDKLKDHYLILSIACFLISILLFVMLIHHNRNLLWVKHFENALKELENRYGDLQNVYHSQISPTLRGTIKISSSKLLAFFLGLCGLTFFTLSVLLLYLHTVK